MWEDAHSYNAPSAGRLADAFQSSFQSKAEMVLSSFEVSGLGL